MLGVDYMRNLNASIKNDKFQTPEKNHVKTMIISSIAYCNGIIRRPPFIYKTLVTVNKKQAVIPINPGCVLDLPIL